MANSILAPDERALAEERAAKSVVHHQTKGCSDRFALGFTKLLRFSVDRARRQWGDVCGRICRRRGGDSRSLQADALDFLGDSANYAISLTVASVKLI